MALPYIYTHPVRIDGLLYIGSQWDTMAMSLWVGDDTFRSTVKNACTLLPIDVEALFTEGQTIIHVIIEPASAFILPEPWSKGHLPHKAVGGGDQDIFILP